MNIFEFVLLKYGRKGIYKLIGCSGQIEPLVLDSRDNDLRKDQTVHYNLKHFVK